MTDSPVARLGLQLQLDEPRRRAGASRLGLVCLRADGGPGDAVGAADVGCAGCRPRAAERGGRRL
jgi:hypothetical protein